MRSSQRRIHPLVLSSVSWVALAIASTLASSEVPSQRVRSDEVDRIYRNWQETIDRKRQEAMIQPTPTVFDRSKYFPSFEDSEGSFIIINGKKVFSRRNSTPTPEISAEVSAATAEVQDGTTAPAAPTAPTPTPGLVSVKVSRVVDGKIVTEEILVTPTPVAANEVVGATGKEAGKPPAGGMEEIRDLLKKSANPMGKRPHLQQKQIAQILKEFMKARKENKNFDEVIPRQQAESIQATLIRLASMAQGGNLQPAVAKLLHKALFLGEQPPPRGAQPVAPPAQPEPPSAPPPSQPEAEEVVIEPEPEEEEVEEYIEVDVYYDEEGRAYYYDENGEAYYLEDDGGGE